jgi:hypothetical protein
MSNSSYRIHSLLVDYHDLFHKYYPDQDISVSDTPIDNSCIICNPPPAFESLSASFVTFWNWYKTVQPAETYSGKTIHFFNRLGSYLFAEEIDPILIPLATSDLLYSIRYHTIPSRSLEQLRHLVIDIAHRSQYFTTALVTEPENPSSPSNNSQSTTTGPRLLLIEVTVKILTFICKSTLL